MENSKTSRLLKLILYLTTSYPKTKDECTDFLGIKDATFYNYCNQLKEIGFDLNQKNGSYFINPNHNNVLQNLLFFSDEEAFVLSEAINNLNTKLPAIASLKHRLLNFLNHDKTVDTYLQKHKNELVQQLVTAIRSKKQVLLLNYSSGNSQTIKNRWVEPFEFKDDFNLLWAFDLEAKKNRQFKTCRIQDVTSMNLSWEFEKEHHALPVDVFRNTGLLNKSVKFIMRLRARNLLIEEYPLTKKHLKNLPDNLFLFETKVAKYEGPARFILGVFDDILMVEDDDFKKFLKKKINKIKNIFSDSTNSGVEGGRFEDKL